MIDVHVPRSTIYDLGPPNEPQYMYREDAMKWDRVGGQWQEYCGRIREKWGLLTESDLNEIAGSREDLVARIEQRYSLDREEAQRQVDDWLRETESQKIRRAGG